MSIVDVQKIFDDAAKISGGDLKPITAPVFPTVLVDALDALCNLAPKFKYKLQLKADKRRAPKRAFIITNISAKHVMTSPAQQFSEPNERECWGVRVLYAFQSHEEEVQVAMVKPVIQLGKPVFSGAKSQPVKDLGSGYPEPCGTNDAEAATFVVSELSKLIHAQGMAPKPGQPSARPRVSSTVQPE